MTTLPALKREYSLFEIATMTRAAPARLLGLADRGHLGPGALADVAVYDDHSRPHRDVPQRASRLQERRARRARRRGDQSAPRPDARRAPAAVEGDARRASRAQFEERYGRPLEATEVRESAVATAAGVEAVFEEVPCRS